MHPAVQKAIELVGRKKLAAALDLWPQSLDGWDEIPAKHVLPIARMTGIPPSELRPDLYPPGEIAWKKPKAQKSA